MVTKGKRRNSARKPPVGPTVPEAVEWREESESAELQATLDEWLESQLQSELRFRRLSKDDPDSLEGG